MPRPLLFVAAPLMGSTPPQRGELSRPDHKVEGAQAEWRCADASHFQLQGSARAERTPRIAAACVRRSETRNQQSPGDHLKRARRFGSLGVPLISLVLLLVLMSRLLLISDIGLVPINYLFDALM